MTPVPVEVGKNIKGVVEGKHSTDNPSRTALIYLKRMVEASTSTSSYVANGSALTSFRNICFTKGKI